MIPASGGASSRLPFGPIAGIAWGARGQLALCRHTSDLAWWKRYRGGRKGTLWVRDADSQPFRQLAIDANVASPIWIDDRLWFVADPGEAPQLFSARVTGGKVEDLRPHTDHPDLAVRFPSTDGQTIVYCHGGDLYRFDPGPTTSRSGSRSISGASGPSASADSHRLRRTSTAGTSTRTGTASP